MAEKTFIEELRTIVEECTAVPIDELIASDDWGAINFNSARPDLERLFSLLIPLKNLPIEELPENIVRKMVSQATESLNLIKGVKEFSLEDENPRGTRDAIVNQIKAAVDGLYPQFAPWIPFLAYQRGDVRENIKKLNSTLDESQKELSKVKSFVGEKKKEIDGIVDASRQAAAEVGVAAFTYDFDEESRESGHSAKCWLIVSGIGAALTLLSAFLFFFVFIIPDQVSTVQIVQQTTTRVVFLGILYTVTFWCSRMYRSAKHQEAMNSHRANALKTFQAFVKATDDPTVRDAVLLETTRSIFAITPTGYIDKGGDAQTNSTNVVEVVKSAADVTTKEPKS